MKYDNHELLEQMASQYALGTLRGRARTRFESICTQNPIARAAVNRWEDRFMSMLSQVKPETPSKQVWTEVERRLGFAKPARESRGFFSGRWAFAAFAGVAAIAIAIGVTVMQTTTQLSVIAVIVQPEHGELWRFETSPGSDKLLVEASTSVTIDAQHAYELWAVPASGAAPVSLGLLPSRGKETLVLSASQLAALNSANKIAVSLEPPGGSPTGTATGPVIHVADVTKLS